MNKFSLSNMTALILTDHKKKGEGATVSVQFHLIGISISLLTRALK
jgi:hypothetical protein